MTEDSFPRRSGGELDDLDEAPVADAHASDPRSGRSRVVRPHSEAFADGDVDPEADVWSLDGQEALGGELTDGTEGVALTEGVARTEGVAEVETDPAGESGAQTGSAEAGASTDDTADSSEAPATDPTKRRSWLNRRSDR